MNVSVSTLLSKILGPRRQANQQSLYQVSSSIARLIGPIVISNVYVYSGPSLSWLVEISVLVFIILVWIFLYRRMIPLQMPAQSDKYESESDVDENETTYSIARF